MPLTDQLVSWWEMPEASGTRVDSVVASANDLTDINTVTRAAGPLGTDFAAQFTYANGEYLERADNASLSITGNITLAFWVYLDSLTANGRVICAKGDLSGGGASNYALYYHSGILRFRGFVAGSGGLGAITASTLGAPSISTWYLAIFRYDGANAKIRVNNGADDSVAHTGTITDGSASFKLGSSGDAGWFMDGRLKGGVWSRAISDSECSELWNGGVYVPYPFSSGQPAARRTPLVRGTRPVEIGRDGVTVCRRYEKSGRVYVPSRKLVGV